MVTPRIRDMENQIGECGQKARAIVFGQKSFLYSKNINKSIG